VRRGERLWKRLVERVITGDYVVIERKDQALTRVLDNALRSTDALSIAMRLILLILVYMLVAMTGLQSKREKKQYEEVDTYTYRMALQLRRVSSWTLSI